MSERPLIIDVSEHQGQLNYNALSQQPPELDPHIIISRAGLGKYGHRDDLQFTRNWSKSKQFDYRRQSYYALHPEHPAGHQFSKWYELAPEIDILPRVIDMEIGNAEPELIANIMWDWSCEILSRDGFRPWVYSRKNLIEPWLYPFWTDEMLNAHYYMLAEYNKGDGQEYDGIKIPDRIQPDRVILKQTTDKMVLGPNLPIVDRDRWLLGDAYHLDYWITSTYIGETSVGDCCEELEQKVSGIELLLSIQDDTDKTQNQIMTVLNDKVVANATEIEKIDKYAANVYRRHHDDTTKLNVRIDDLKSQAVFEEYPSLAITVGNHTRRIDKLNERLDAQMLAVIEQGHSLSDRIDRLIDGLIFENKKRLDELEKLESNNFDAIQNVFGVLSELEAKQKENMAVLLLNLEKVRTLENKTIPETNHAHFYMKWEWFKKLTGYYNQRG